ncbi:Gfo/Idh/MocA family protein [Flavihumibacter sp. UBA7668]|uniref:Gfo/Idh/MocA family protein n=1 Tax=Flavihumibacter sp. UBA7668 TaxID=1946542 RepID=UPI0025BBAB4C|nr:Gfo/Idh/MocA family oxidoreductase [Flavihumibacter sp. UBA7668]
MKESSTIRWGIIGAGKIARAFATDFQYLQNAELVAIASRNQKKSIAFAAEFSIPEAINYENLFNHPGIDAIYIATPHNFHFEQASLAIRAGKAVLCEKPITVNMSEYQQLIALAKQEKVFLMEAMWSYFIPALQVAKNWINNGLIGDLKLIQADFCFPSEPTVERLWNPALAGGALLDIGIYPIAFANYFMNRMPASIRASAQLSTTGIDERTGIHLEYGSTSANLYTSIVTKGTNTGYLFGTKGYIKLPSFWRSITIERFNNEDELMETYSDGRTTRGFHFEMQHVTDCLRQGLTESPVMSFEQSMRLQEIMGEVRKQIGLRFPFE